MPMKVGGKGHQQSYDPTTGKYGSGNAMDENENSEKEKDETNVKENVVKEEDDENKSNSKQEKGVDWLSFLIEDENEAIKGYAKAIAHFQKQNDKKIVKVLRVILKDEEEHKKVLELLKK